MKPALLATVVATPLLLVLAAPVAAQPTDAAQLLAGYAAQAGAKPSAARGQALFNRRFSGAFASCADCHGALPVKEGKDLVSEKPIAPLAPAAHPGRFDDKARVDYRFRINCKDVVGRECTALEKADLLAWLTSLKP